MLGYIGASLVLQQPSNLAELMLLHVLTLLTCGHKDCMSVMITALRDYDAMQARESVTMCKPRCHANVQVQMPVKLCPPMSVTTCEPRRL